MHVSIGRSAVLIAFVTAFAIYAYAQTARPTLGGSSTVPANSVRHI